MSHALTARATAPRAPAPVGVPTRRATGRLVLALAAAGAGVIHLALGPEHSSEWVVLGGGFYLSGVLQLLWAGALARRESRLLTGLGALGSAALIAAWVISRTSGLPVGPEAFAPEGVGLADVLCVAMEAVVALGAVVLLRRPTAGRTPTSRVLARSVVAASAALVLTGTGVAVAAPGHEHGSTAACPTAPHRPGSTPTTTGRTTASRPTSPACCGTSTTATPATSPPRSAERSACR